MEKSEILNDLAAVFRWTARLDMHEGIANHFSVCSQDNDGFFINRSGSHFSQIKASDLIHVNNNNYEQLKDKPEIVDPTAINIHGEIHKKVPHAKCVLHAHSKYATVLSTLKNPFLPPIDQNTMRFFNRVAFYNDFGGLGFENEAKKMSQSMGNYKIMMLANHGIITSGETVAKAFDDLYYFEKACETYITALTTNQKLNIVSDKVAENTAQDWENYPIDMGKQHLEAIRKILDTEDQSYKN
tara:strand:- start:634 stop:1359 length:726 start_codon:yes stop_codon:yes gene_type:complete